MTPTDLITQILKVSGVNGVGQSPNATDLNDMLIHLNLLLGQWSAERTMVYHLVNASVNVTGATSYTVGAGGDFNVTRPAIIDSCFYRYTAITPNTDYVLRQIDSREDYNRIVVKQVGTWPDSYFYDAGYPLGSLYPYPIPTQGQLWISTKAVLSQFGDLTTQISFPPEYLNALMWNGASIARVVYGQDPDGAIERRAAGALGVIRTANFAPPHLRMPMGIPGRRSRYNVYSDTGG